MRNFGCLTYPLMGLTLCVVLLLQGCAIDVEANQNILSKAPWWPVNSSGGIAAVGPEAEPLLPAGMDRTQELIQFFKQLPEEYRSLRYFDDPMSLSYRRDLATGNAIYVDYWNHNKEYVGSVHWVLLSLPYPEERPDTFLYVYNVDAHFVHNYSTLAIVKLEGSDFENITDVCISPPSKELQLEALTEGLRIGNPDTASVELGDLQPSRWQWWPKHRELVCLADSRWSMYPAKHYYWYGGKFEERPSRKGYPTYRRDTIHVRTFSDLVLQARPHRVLVLDVPELKIEGGYFDLDRYYGELDVHFPRSEFYDFLKNTFLYLEDFEIRGGLSAPTHLLQENYQETVLTFHHCSNIRLRNIKGGHGEQGEYRDLCHAGVIDLENCAQTAVEDCKLYGSGLYGIRAYDCKGIQVRNTGFHDCTSSFVDLVNVKDVVMENCRFEMMPDWYMIELQSCGTVAMSNCILDGRNMATGAGVFRLLDNSVRPRILGGQVINMSCPFLANTDSISFSQTALSGNRFRSAYATDTLR
jgi:hypothetical protein